MMEGKTKKDQEKPNPISLHIDFRVEDYKEIASTHLLGNYPIYSKLNSNHKWNDPRLRVLRPDYFINKIILDIGCNEGILAIPIAMKYHPQYVKGIEVDQKLIARCVANLEKFKSVQKHPSKELVEQIDKLPLYFQQKLKGQLCLQLSLKDQVQFIPKQTKNLPTFPNNLEFKLESALTVTYSESYDCILCMKVTKWIHLAFGDEGIKRLLQNIGNKLNDGGLLILEVQPWASYKKKTNLHPVYKQNYKKIFFKPDRFHMFLKTLGIQEIETIEPNEENRLKHRISVFQKKGFYSDD